MDTNTNYFNIISNDILAVIFSKFKKDDYNNIMKTYEFNFDNNFDNNFYKIVMINILGKTFINNYDWKNIYYSWISYMHAKNIPSFEAEIEFIKFILSENIFNDDILLHFYFMRGLYEKSIPLEISWYNNFYDKLINYIKTEENNNNIYNIINKIYTFINTIINSLLSHNLGIGIKFNEILNKYMKLMIEFSYKMLNQNEFTYYLNSILDNINEYYNKIMNINSINYNGDFSAYYHIYINSLFKYLNQKDRLDLWYRIANFDTIIDIINTYDIDVNIVDYLSTLSYNSMQDSDIPYMINYIYDNYDLSQDDIRKIFDMLIQFSKEDNIYGRYLDNDILYDLLDTLYKIKNNIYVRNF